MMQRLQISALPSATIICSFLVVSLIVPSIYTFNLDTVNFVKYDEAPDSMFGFSIALHKEQQQNM